MLIVVLANLVLLVKSLSDERQQLMEVQILYG